MKKDRPQWIDPLLGVLGPEGTLKAVLYKHGQTWLLGVTGTVEEALALCDARRETESQMDIFNYIGMPMPHPWIRTRES